MQQTWKTDADKLTFISCTPTIAAQGHILVTESDAFDRMLGDVNLFLTDSDDEDSHGIIGEVELMIASKQHQSHGYGRASLLAFLEYFIVHEQEILQQYSGANSSLGKCLSGTPSRFLYLRAKIDESNHRSIGLFESLGFAKVGKTNYFGEVELRLVGEYRAAVEASWRRYADVEDYQELHYEGGND